MGDRDAGLILLNDPAAAARIWQTVESSKRKSADSSPLILSSVRKGEAKKIAPNASFITGYSSLAELTFVVGGIEMAYRFGTESVIVDRPNFVAADSNAFRSVSSKRNIDGN